MDILFINPTDGPGLKKETNGTLLLGTILLKNGFSADVLRFYQFANHQKDYALFVEEVSQMALSKKPACVSFYTMWPYLHIELGIARRIKELSPDTAIAMGGPLTTLYPQTVLEHIPWVDYVCCGEGENTIIPFAKALLSNSGFESVPGLYYRANGTVVHSELPVPISELNELPQWDQRLLPSDPRNEEGITSRTYYMPVDVGRGCPFNCTFCCSNRVWKRKYRLKSADKIVEDIRYYYDTYGIRSFLFSHDAFTVNNRLVAEVCDKIIESGMDITWDCTTRVNCVNEELLLKMKEAGMRNIQMGVETGSSRMQQIINKKLDLEHLRRIVSFLLKNDIKVWLFFMYGFPEETEEDLNETLNLILDLLEMGIQNVSMGMCRFNPGTDMTEQYFDELILPVEPELAGGRMYGYDEEMPMIEQHKELFPFFYHLSTPLRNEYYLLQNWAHMCKKMQKMIPYIRSFYGRNALQFYKDFVRYNPQQMPSLAEAMENTIKATEHSNITQVCALIHFLNDSDRISRAKTDEELIKSYEFCYLDHARKLPLDMWKRGETKIKLSKVNGKIEMKILDMR